MAVMSSMNETVLALGIDELAVNSFSILNEPASWQKGPRLHPCCTPRADSTTSKPLPSNANRSFGGSRAHRFDA